MILPLLVFRQIADSRSCLDSDLHSGVDSGLDLDSGSVLDLRSGLDSS